MEHATSYQHCTPSDAPEAPQPLHPDFHMLTYYATEIGVVIGHIEHDKAHMPEWARSLADGQQRTLRRIRAGIEREISQLAAHLSEPQP